MSEIPKLEFRLYSGEAVDLFHLLSPYIEKAGHKWAAKEVELDPAGYPITDVIIEPNEN